MAKQSDLILKQMEVGGMDNFEYFIGDSSTGEVAVVDPAWDVDFLRDEAKRNGYTITSIFLTHGHMDHVNGVDELLSTHDIPVIISKYETGVYLRGCKDVKKVSDRDKVKIGNLEIECLHTPGHTAGGQCFRYGNVLITGDTVFIDGCGRCDLPGSDPKAMYHALYDIIMKLPDTVVLYPGHNYGPTPYATLASQKKTNPYFQCQDIEEFLSRRMGLSI